MKNTSLFKQPSGDFTYTTGTWFQGFLFQLYLQDPSNQRERKKTTVDGNLSKKNMDLDVRNVVKLRYFSCCSGWNAYLQSLKCASVYLKESQQYGTCGKSSDVAHPSGPSINRIWVWFQRKKTPWSLVMIVYIQWLGRGDRCGARGIHIPY